MSNSDADRIPGATASLDMFWLALAQGREEEVGKYLARAGYSNVLDAMNDLHDDVMASARDLRDRQDIEQALEMERLAEEIASYLRPQ